MAIRKSTSAVETEVKVTGEGRYARELKRTEQALDDVRDGARDLDSAFRNLGGGSAVAAAAIGAIVAEVEIAARVYGDLWRAGERLIEQYGRMGERGGAVDAVAGYYERISDPGLLQRLQRVSNWQMGQQDIMESFNTTMRAGIVSQDQFVEFFEQTVAAVRTSGEDLEDVWDGVSEALSVGGLDIFERLGVNIFDVEEKLERLGLTAETVRGRSAALKLILGELNEITGDATNRTTNLGDAWQSAGVRAGDFYDQVSRIVSTSPEAVAFFDTFISKLFSVEGGATTAGKAISEIALHTIRSMAVGIEWTSRFVGSLSRIALEVGEIFPDPGDIPSWAPAFVRESAQRVETIRGIHREIIETSEMMEDAARAARAASFAAAGTGAGAGAGAGAGIITPPTGRPGRAAAAAERDIAFELLDFDQMRIEALGRIDELSQSRTESDSLLLDITQTQIDLQQELADAEQERQEAWLTRIQAIGDAHQKAIEWERRNAEAAVEAARARQAALMENLSTAGETVSTIGGIFNMVASSQERASRATEIAYRIEGGLLGVKNTIKAIEAGAEAVGAYASLNIIGGLAWTAKAAQHTAAAVMAFTQLAKGSGAGAGAGAAAAATSPGTFIPARTDTMTGPQRPAAGGNIYVYFTMGEGDFARQVMTSEYRLSRRGQFAQAPSSGIRFTG